MIRATRMITCVGLLALAASLPLSEHEERLRDIYEPWFNEPDMNTTWIAGHDYDVRWNIDGAPPVASTMNGTLRVYILPYVALPLAENFTMSDGHVAIKAPVLDGKYRLWLTGGFWDVQGPKLTFKP